MGFIINYYLWYILIFGFMGLGLYLTVILKFPQFTRFLPAIKQIIQGFIDDEEAGHGKMTPFQALSTAVAAQVGTANILGVMTAIIMGGPGAAFWMLVAAFFGMATIFAETVLAQKYRHTKDGQVVGGPAYYMEKGLGSKFLGKFFSITCILALGIIGIMLQSSWITASVVSTFQISVASVIVGLSVLVILILMGGIERIASFSEKLVPIVVGTYIIGSVFIVIMNPGSLVLALKSIFTGAFNPAAIGGGTLGITIQQSIRFGLGQGLLTSEAGFGSTPHAHALAQTDHPAEQGFMAMTGVFVSTFLIAISTVLVDLSPGLGTKNGFVESFGFFGDVFLSLSIFFFSLTTIVGWYFFAESNIRYLFSGRANSLIKFKTLVIIALIAGSLIDSTILWELGNLSIGIMALPNLVALLLLSKEARDILDDYDIKRARNMVIWIYEYEDE